MIHILGNVPYLSARISLDIWHNPILEPSSEQIVKFDLLLLLRHYLVAQPLLFLRACYFTRYLGSDMVVRCWVLIISAQQTFRTKIKLYEKLNKVVASASSHKTEYFLLMSLSYGKSTQIMWQNFSRMSQFQSKIPSLFWSVSENSTSMYWIVEGNDGCLLCSKK